jgi:plastocyanin
MRRCVRFVVVAVFGLAVHSAPASAATVTVQTGFSAGPPPSGSFTPNTINLAIGDTVTVVNGAGGAGRPHDLIWQDGAPGFATAPPPFSANIMPWTSSRTFTTPGDFPFVCSFHQSIGMTGIVHVAAPTPAPGTPPPAAGPAQPAPAPASGPADVTAPTLTATAKATRRAVTLRVRLGESSRVTVVVRRGKRTIARKAFSTPAAGRATLRVPVRTRPGRLTVTITAVDAAGNTSRRTLRLRAR